MNLSRKVKLKMIIDYKATRCYVIDFFKHNLITKTLKRSFNWIKLNLKKLVIAIITFIIIMTFAVAEEVYITKIILHNTFEIKFSIFIIINDFSSL